MDERMKECMDGWMDGWMDGGMDREKEEYDWSLLTVEQKGE